MTDRTRRPPYATGGLGSDEYAFRMMRETDEAATRGGFPVAIQQHYDRLEMFARFSRNPEAIKEAERRKVAREDNYDRLTELSLAFGEVAAITAEITDPDLKNRLTAVLTRTIKLMDPFTK